MLVKCSKCGSEASSKCPELRTIFPTPDSERESGFWQGMGFELKPAGEGYISEAMRLHVTMLAFKGEDEETAMTRFIKKMQRIPDDELKQYICKHFYKHTEDCRICSFRMVASDASL